MPDVFKEQQEGPVTRVRWMVGGDDVRELMGGAEGRQYYAGPCRLHVGRVCRPL